MSMHPEIVLAIESAICGGSISLIRHGIELGSWIGTSNVSKAEYLLTNIEKLLTENNIPRDEIDLIAASAGPGSFTGIRIGFATAIGLKTGLGIGMASESALRAMALMQQDVDHMIIAVPVGRNVVCYRSFDKTRAKIDEQYDSHILAEDKFMQMLQSSKDHTFVIHGSLYEKIEPRHNVINFGRNIARAIGLVCGEDPDRQTEPLFISKAF